MARSVLLVIIDCLRADHVSACGYHRHTTPTLDRLAECGMLWERAYSVSSWTKPVVTSMLTGLYPSQHGAFEGIKRSKGRTTVTTDVLQSNAPTLAERFAQHGWRCGAFLNNAQLGTFSRLDRGFDTYLPTLGKADRLIATFRDWLEHDPQRPVFAYLHFLEAHWPYKPRRRHVRQFGGDRDANYFRDFSARDYGHLRRELSHGQAGLTPVQLEHMIRMYDGAVRRLDGKLKVLLTILDELSLRDRFAVVVTADHGEEFLDHGHIGHGQSLYDELTHVPLVACVPNGPAGVRYRQSVSLVDLPDTLLRMAGLDEPPAERDLTEPSTRRSAVVAELRIRRRYTQTLRTDRWKLHRQFKFRPGDGASHFSRLPHRLIHECPYTLQYELYDVEKDPYERADLAANPNHAADRDRLAADLDRWWQQTTDSTVTGVDQGTVVSVELEAQIVERLRALGYVD